MLTQWANIIFLIFIACYLVHCIRTDKKLHRLMDEVEKKLKEEDQNGDETHTDDV